jgi:hypothetical protein
LVSHDRQLLKSIQLHFLEMLSSTPNAKCLGECLLVNIMELQFLFSALVEAPAQHLV